MRRTVGILLSALILVGCTEYEPLSTIDTELENRMRTIAPDGQLDYYVLPSSDQLSAIPQSAQNPLTPEKVALGKFLFFETGLARGAKYAAGMQTYSCGSCHVPSAGFVPGRQQGIADGGRGFGDAGLGRQTIPGYRENELDVQGARPLSVLNTAFVENTSWSGKFGATGVNAGLEEAWEDDESTHVNFMGLEGLESQNIEGLKLHRMVVNAETVAELGYKELFDDAFRDFSEEERYSEVTASFAISAYLRSLLTDQAPYQHWLRGDKDAMTERQKQGALLFYGKAGCYRCHQGPALNAVRFYALGVRDLFENSGVFNTNENDARNFGRGAFTGQPEDLYKFKVPQLYNLKNARFFFHGSSKNNMWSVVDYFNKAIPENDRVPAENLAKEFHPLDLTTMEIEALVDFLENGLFDPNLDRYVPEQILSGNCFPNNDPDSRQDLGCL